MRDAAACDGRGAALRYPLLKKALSERQTHEGLLRANLERLEVDVQGADLLVDLGYLSGDEEIAGEDLAEQLTELTAVGSWRSFVLLGTSMPRMLGGGIVGEAKWARFRA